jgi:hypothetical protein
MINFEIYHKGTLTPVNEFDLICDDFAGIGVLDTNEFVAYDISGITHKINTEQYDVEVSISSKLKGK